MGFIKNLAIKKEFKKTIQDINSAYQDIMSCMYPINRTYWHYNLRTAHASFLEITKSDISSTILNLQNQLTRLKNLTEYAVSQHKNHKNILFKYSTLNL